MNYKFMSFEIVLELNFVLFIKINSTTLSNDIHL